jgi:hypothetical protein
LNISNLTAKEYSEIGKIAWDKVVINFSGDINYSHWMISYIVIYNKNNNIKNLSYILYNNEDQPIAIVPLFVERIADDYQISMGQNAVCSPLFNPRLEQKEIIKLYEHILNNIDNLSLKYRCKLARFQIPPLNMEAVNYYKLFGYGEQILSPDWYIFKCDFSYILTLKNKALSDIRSNIRGSFKSLINKTKKNTNLIVLDENNTDRQIFDKYVKTHYEIKGNNRVQQAFEDDYVAICNGFESILICEYENVYVGVVVIYTFNKKAIYNSAMQRHNYEKIYPNHFLMWESISYLYNNGYDYYINGEQVIYSDNYKVSDKERNLSYFKMAWGAEIYPWMKSQKHYEHNTI